jgi:hypothetical protein
MSDRNFNSKVRWLQLLVTKLALLLLVSCMSSNLNDEAFSNQIASEESVAVVAATQIVPIETPSIRPLTTPTLLPTPTQKMEPARSSLGYLLYVDENGIAKTDLDTGEVIRIVELSTTAPAIIRNAVMSPDRRWVAYWQNTTDVSTLTLLDMEDTNSQVAILTLTDRSDWTPYLFWSADSLHLFITLEPQREPAVLDQQTQNSVSKREHHLYSHQTGSIESWDRDCDRIGLSPRTEQVAMWCPSIEGSEIDYAVIEWGGDIWFTIQPPDTVLKIRDPEFSIPTWHWSEDSQQIIYANQDRVSPRVLTLATVKSGEIVTETLGDYGLSYAGLNWSADQRYIAFKGQCPTISPCLLVLDLQTIRVIWTSEGLGEANRGLHGHFWHSSDSLLLQPSFIDGSYNVFIIDVAAQAVIRQIELEGSSRFAIGWLP